MGNQSGLDMLITFKYWFFKYPLSCSLLHYISPPLPWLQPHSIPCFLLVSRLFDFVKGRFFLDRCLTRVFFQHWCPTKFLLSFRCPMTSEAPYWLLIICCQIVKYMWICAVQSLYLLGMCIVVMWVHGGLMFWGKSEQRNRFKYDFKNCLYPSTETLSKINYLACMAFTCIYHGFMWAAVYSLTTRCRQISHGNLSSFGRFVGKFSVLSWEKYQGSEEVLEEPPAVYTSVYTADVRSLSQHWLLTGATTL